MARRSSAGAGSIYFRASDQRWCCAVTLEGGKRKVIYGKTQKEVSTKLRKLLRAKEDGQPLVADKQTVADYLAQWLDKHRARVRPITYQNYVTHSRLYITPHIGAISLGKLKTEHVDQMMAAIAGAPSTRMTVLKVLRAALNAAVKEERIVRNVASRATAPRVPKRPATVFTAEQAKHFLQIVRGHKYEPVFVTLLGIGLRSGEVMGLQWADIDFAGAQLWVRRSVSRVAGGHRLGPPKTEDSVRRIDLPAFVVQTLRLQERLQYWQRQVAGASWRASDQVFTTRIGTLLDHSNLYTALQELLVTHGLPRMRVHDLRHACATLMLSEGVEPQLVQAMLGHATIAQTMDTYGHVLPSKQRAAAAVMDALLDVG